MAGNAHRLWYNHRPHRAGASEARPQQAPLGLTTCLGSAHLASIMQMNKLVSRGSAGEYQADEQAVVAWFSWEYQADERAGVAGLSWRISGR